MRRAEIAFLLLALAVLGANSSAPAAEPPAYVLRIATHEEFDRVSIPETLLPGVERSGKYLVPASDDPSLLPTLFQDVNRHAFHQEFLRAEFPERFPGLTGEEYLALVERRATRSYFAGIIYRFRRTPAAYGFDVFTAAGDPAELPTMEEARRIHERLSAALTAGPLAYAPRSGEAIRAAEGWTDPGFPIDFAFGGGLPEYIPYTRAENHGRVKVMTREEFAEANEGGLFGWQDILVLEEAPADIEGVIAGVITGEIQGELGHLAIRTARRGTPNAYLKDPAAAFAAWDGKLVKLGVEAAGYRVTESTLEEAERWWADHRPRLGAIPTADETYRRLDEAGEAPIDGPVDPVTRFGGKGASFARLHRLLEERNRVPGFLIPFAYYREFLDANRGPSPLDPRREVTYAEYIEELLADPAFRGDSQRRHRELERLRRLMEEEGMVDPTAVRAIALRVVSVFGGGERPVRFRSSSNVEDLLEFNGAGLYSSTSACAADDLDSGTGGPSRCDVREDDERGVARALKRVWASLWNFRAFEEREYYQIDHRQARMAVLVSEAFPDEAANGVSFTGNPSLRGDRRFLVNAQIGDLEVVFPDPGIVPEKVLLEMEGGQVARIVRVRRSSLSLPGEMVMTDEHLRELGQVMARVEAGFPVDLGGHDPDEVLLDFEFKVDAEGRVRLKQVRPFLIADSEPAPEVKVRVPPGILLCASFREGRKASDVLALKARAMLRAGETVLRADASAGSQDLVEWIELSPEGPRHAPVGPGLWSGQPAGPGAPFYIFELAQEIVIEGERFWMVISNLRVPIPFPEEVVLDEAALTWHTNPYSLRMGGHFGETPSFDEQERWFLPCDLGRLPRSFVEARLAGGESVRFEERFQDLINGTGPAELQRAEVDLGGEVIEVSDYWRLVYTAGHHNDTPFPELWAIFDGPRDVPGVGRAAGLRVAQNHRGETPTATWLAEGLADLKPLEITFFRRWKEGDERPPEFRRGDADLSGRITVTDAVAILRHAFQGEPLPCHDSADVDDAGAIGPDDAILLLAWLFFGLDAPAAPGPVHCGFDPTAGDELPACPVGMCVEE